MEKTGFKHQNSKQIYTDDHSYINTSCTHTHTQIFTRLPSQPGPPETSWCWSQFSTPPPAQSTCCGREFCKSNIWM